MFPEIIAFRKSYEGRRQDYDHLFRSNDPCSKMHRLWSSDLELIFDRPGKWQALWQLSEESCAEFHVLYPSTVLVTVQEMIFSELSAIVIVEETEEDTQFPGVVHVPLFELFPIKEQATPLLSCSIKNSADYLDRCRFFFLYLWYPWDNADEVPISEWAEKHLENRLKLQCDIRNGTIDRATSHYVQQLLTSSLIVTDAIEGEEEVLSPSDSQKLNTIRNLIDREVIKMELNLFEIPELRYVVVLVAASYVKGPQRPSLVQLRYPMSSYIKEKKQVYNSSNVTLITQPSTLTSISTLLERAKSHVPPMTQLNISSQLNVALESTPPGSMVILSSGTHSFRDLGALAFGGRLGGVGMQPEETKIVPLEQSPARYMFLTSYAPIHYENLSIERGQGVLIWLRDGSVRMENCHLIGRQQNEASLTRGVVVQPGCRLEMVNCVMSGLGTAIVIKDGASAHIESCKITRCTEGIKMMDSVSVTLKTVSIEDCTSAGLVLDTCSPHEVTRGSVDILQVSGLIIEDCSFKNNKTDAYIDCLPIESI